MKCICDELILSQYLEKDLDLETMQQITGHIQKCRLCRKKMERLEAAIRLIQSVEEVRPPRDYLNNVSDGHKKP